MGREENRVRLAGMVSQQMLPVVESIRSPSPNSIDYFPQWPDIRHGVGNSTSPLNQIQTRTITSALAVSVAIPTMVTSPGGGAAATAMTEVAARLAAICDVIHEHHKSGRPIEDDDVATISAMIEDLAATASAGRPPKTKLLLRLCSGAAASSCSYEEVGGDDDDGELGVGAFGVVVMARHRDTGELVAVKTLHPEHAGDNGGRGLARLLREASFMAACSGHPSLVSLLGVERMPCAAAAAAATDTAEWSLVMEYVGPNLLDVLRARGGEPFPEADVRVIMRQLLAGAAAMHRHGIVHRDIKSENILVVSGVGAGDVGAVKICDLGSAKSTFERHTMFHIAGTLEYMAPEVLARDPHHGAPADAWSLGCVMAELLLAGGELAFRGEDEGDQMLAIFDVLGAPEEAAWRALRPRVLVAGEVNVLRERQRKAQHRSRLREMFPEDVLSKEGFEVLEGLLTCDPKKRMTAAAALRCAWFADGDKVQEQRHETTSSLLTSFSVCEIST
ncbi:hypothetical protein HU200_058235 [Digitaria exilis]|uniref:[RNA-polymerase]-subunit kinase n=1 Tax=Digitaria exilis TaxID=1010633 RepID=A0A835ADU0_9POAL|nr:hypothetical protein HU200_058235 [Digitaria exilis]